MNYELLIVKRENNDFCKSAMISYKFDRFLEASPMASHRILPANWQENSQNRSRK
jgi:hypothetical protein